MIKLIINMSLSILIVYLAISVFLAISPKLNEMEDIDVIASDNGVSMVKGSKDMLPFHVGSNSAYRIMKKDNIYHVYLSSSIDEMVYYVDLIKGLKALNKQDKVIIHMANYGGLVHSGVQIINAMKASNALITVEVEGPSYSMGAVITCAGDEIKLHPYTYLMFHHYSGTFSGKGADSRHQIEALDELVRNILVKECIAKGILTLDQVDDIMNGVDVYIHPHKLRRK